jgi:hypothetical protein
MLTRLRPRSAYDVIAALALFLVVTGGTAFAVVAANQVNSASIVDGEVKNPDLANDSVGPAKVKDDSLRGADVNEATLGTVPNADLVDGLNGSELREFAGFGLKKANASIGPIFSVNDNAVQRRVATPCPPATAVRVITRSGAPDCARGPEAWAGSANSAQPICDSGCPVRTAVLPASGNMAIFANVLIESVSGDTSLSVDCDLVQQLPKLRVPIDHAGFHGDAAEVTLSLQGIYRGHSNGDARLICEDRGVSARASSRAFLAIRLDNTEVHFQPGG